MMGPRRQGRGRTSDLEDNSPHRRLAGSVLCTEALIQAALVNLFRGRTAFIIAQRLSTIVNADRIIVMDGGLTV